jgi:protein-disulfide isomerase
LTKPNNDYPPGKVPTAKRKTAWSLFAVLASGALLVALGAFFVGGFAWQEPTQYTRDAARDANSPSASADEALQVGADPAHPALGDEDAPVVMVEYADFQCPFCGKFAHEVEPRLIEEYVESGVLKLEWRDFPYLGQKSVNAALAARAAWEQDKFWEYHELLYKNQGTRNNDTLTDDKLFAFAQELGLDIKQFEADLTGGKFEPALSRDFEEATRKGVSGTPTFFINDKPLVGAQPIAVFEEAIDKAAREAEGAS